MNNHEAIELTNKYVMPTYGRLPIAFVKGDGARLWDADGKEYLDFVAGIAVLGPGHCHPKVAQAVCEQAKTLMHTSNLYNVIPQALLAKKLCEISCADKAFFCNSGAEANEAALKLARKWAGIHKGDGVRDIVSAYMSFHGRTLMTLAATGQAKFSKSFHPLPAGFKYVDFNDIDALKASVDDRTCAIMLEPIQAEGGIIVPSPGYLADVKQLCEEKNLLLIFDEVQTGMGRTGEWFGYMDESVEPDIFTLAKSLGGGFPIGACLAKDETAEAFVPGDHASTFGGNYTACAAALATIEAMEEEGMVQNAKDLGQYFMSRVETMKAEHNFIAGVRGRGLLLGLELQNIDGKKLGLECLEAGLVVNALSESLLRIAPPLNITKADIDKALDLIVKSAANC